VPSGIVTSSTKSREFRQAVGDDDSVGSGDGVVVEVASGGGVEV
jgi:hypothetical protein